MKSVGRPAGVDSSATRAAILASAQRLFARQGYSETTITDIARDAGLTPPAVHFHFQDKRSIFEVVFRRMNDANYGDAERTVLAATSFAEKVTALLESVMRSMRHESDLADFIATAPIEVRRHLVLNHLADDRRWPDLYAHIVRAGVEEGSIAADDEASTRGVVSAMMFGIAQVGAAVSPRQRQSLVHGFERLFAGEVISPD